MSESRLDLQSLSLAIRQFCQERDWDQFHDAKNLAIGLITEASELLEEFRFQTPEQCEAMFEDAQKRAAIEDELADVLFFVLRFADRYKVDLPSVLSRKIEKNAQKYPIEKAKGSNKKYDKL